jgi:hypothetical protein
LACSPVLGTKLPALCFVRAGRAVRRRLYPAKGYRFQSRVKQIYTDGKVDDDARFDLWQPALNLAG